MWNGTDLIPQLKAGYRLPCSKMWCFYVPNRKNSKIGGGEAFAEYQRTAATSTADLFSFYRKKNHSVKCCTCKTYFCTCNFWGWNSLTALTGKNSSACRTERHLLVSQRHVDPCLKPRKTSYWKWSYATACWWYTVLRMSCLANWLHISCVFWEFLLDSVACLPCAR